MLNYSVAELRIMRHRLSTFLIIASLSLGIYDISAQDNPYGIDDALYAYFQKANKHIDKLVGYKMADTLFYKAQKRKDKKVQCLALCLKVTYFQRTKQYKKEKAEFNRVTPFILSTPYKNYYFDCWSLRIHGLIDEKKYTEALTEIGKYRDKAYKMKNDYGIIESFNSEAGLYYNQGVFKYALPLYEKAAEYAERINDKNIYRYYKNVAMTSFPLHRFDEGERFAKKSIERAPYDELRIPGYCILLSIYCLKDTSDEVIDRTYDTLMKLDNECYNKSSYRYSFKEAMYNYYKFHVRDENMASEMASSKMFEPDSSTILLRRAQVYEKRGNYKESSHNYILYCKYLDDKNIQDGKFLLTSLVPQVDYENLKFEKDALLNDIAKSRLKQMNVNTQLIKLKTEKTKADIIKRDKEHSIMLNELMSKNIAIAHQNKMIENGKLNAEQRLDQEKARTQNEHWKMALITIIALTLILILTVYIIYNYKRRARLKKAKETAKRSEQTKSLFFQNMNHEIRSPLNAIIGFNDLLCSDKANEISSDEKTEIINMISTNSNLLVTLVNDVLDLSNFESGSYKLNFVSCDVRHLCRTTLESIRGKQADGVELNIKTNQPGIVLLDTDEQRLQQILTNYLTNACKYTTKGSITLAYDILPDIIRFSVTDTGCGIKPEDAEKVFKRFSMLDKAKTGNGLGLHICKIIAKLLNGNVYLDKTYKNGARFIFDHPIGRTLIILLMACISFCNINATNYHKKNYSPTIYAQKIEDNLLSKKALAMTDTMMWQANKTHDATAKCMALALRTKYYEHQKDESLMLKNFYECKKYATMYKKERYMYIAWNAVINYYLSKYDEDNAIKQLDSFRQNIQKSHNEVGIGRYLFGLATFHFTNHRYATALSYYIKTQNYSKDLKRFTTQMIGRCYKLLKDYNNAIINLSTSLRMAKTDNEKVGSLIPLLECYSVTNDRYNALLTKRELDKIRITFPHITKSPNYHKSMYFYYMNIKDNNDKALEELLMASKGMNNKYNESLYYYYKGDYKKANDLLKKDVIYYTDIYIYEPIKHPINYISQFDYQKAMNAKNQLAMHKIQQEIKMADNMRTILQLKYEKSEWDAKKTEIYAKAEKERLKVNGLKLESKKAEHYRQALIKEGQIKENILENEKMKYKISVVSIIVLVIVFFTVVIIYTLHKREKRLAEETAEAQEKERRKNNFFENMNHEIREPLNNIVQLNLILNDTEKKIPEEKKSEIMTTLHKQADYLSGLINTVLDISKMESGTFQLSHDFINIYDFCSKIASKYKNIISNDVDIKVIPDDKDINHDTMFTADSIRLANAIEAYIKIACEYTQKGSIMLLYQLKPDRIRFIVINISEDIKHAGLNSSLNITKMDDANERTRLRLHLVKLTAELFSGTAFIDLSFSSGAKFVLEIPKT